MTRLITEWITDMKNTVVSWDETLMQKSGLGLISVASKASGISEERIISARDNMRIAVVPITSGQGVIRDFAESVAAILAQMKFSVFVTKGTDVSGIYEAQTEGADIVYFADDDRYIAMNIRNNSVGENDKSTARGYIEVLEGMLMKRNAGSSSSEDTLEGKEVLILGYGRVGHQICEYLITKGSNFALYDYSEEKQEEVRRDGRKLIASTDEIKNYSLILDATSSGNWLSSEMLASDCLIAAPGIPFSLDEEAAELFEKQSVHDNLEIGTAVMLAFALSGDSA